MADYQLLAELLGLPHVQVAGYQIINSERIEVRIESRLEAAVCPDCQRVSAQIHDTAEPQTLRDLTIWGRQCWLRYAPRRFACATCQSTFTERVAWREPGFAYTLRYAQHVYARTQQADMAQVALNEGLSQDTVRSIFERWAKKHSTTAATRL